MSDAHQRYRAIHRSLMQALPCSRTSHQAKAIQVLSALICGIVGANHSHLPRVASKSPSFGVKRSSQIKRYQRWLMNERVSSETFYLPFVQALLLSLAHVPLVFVMDGSAVGRGCVMLMLSLRYRGRALPIAWTVVQGKKGHFPAATHCQLLTQVVPLIPQGADVIFLGDGEFDSIELQRRLEELNWRYVCRTACNTLFDCGEPMPHLNDLGITPGEWLILRDVKLTAARYGPVLALIVWERGYNEPIYLVSNFSDEQTAVHWYRRRAHIETFFSDQKSRGFRLDLSHLSDPARLHRLLIAACLAYLWLIALGSQALADKLVSQIHRSDRCDLSLFQLGLRLLDWFLDTACPIPVDFSPVPALALPD
jgi:Transposase DDE domain